ncbi:MAG: LCP family protein [Lachnospiraceae bacterium]|nr:LCP family protein [Lachnospiraceae bacterium]MBR1852146.1 LCP family protein [Lachnospiraceae bacterium]
MKKRQGRDEFVLREDDPAEDWDAKGPRSRTGQVSRDDRDPEAGSHGRTRKEQKEFRQAVQKEVRREVKKQVKRERKRGGLRRFLFTLILFVCLCLAGIYAVVNHAYGKMNYQEIASVKSEPMKEDGVINILLIGNDSRENGEDGRSDAMILLSVSTRTKTIAMTSLLRDMYVEIPGHDGNRLNAAYAFGGAELLMETIEKNLGITVNRYVQVNFEAFANLVDAVGGVDLELSSGEKELVNGYLNEYNELTGKEFGTDYLQDLTDGMVHLNGPQALAYSRNRYIGTDFGRTERQRKVLAEVVHQLPQALWHPRALENGLLPNLTTNLTVGECYRLTLMAPFGVRYDMQHGSIPLDGTYRDATIRKMAVLEVDFDANRKYLQELLYEKKKENG